MQSVRTVPIYIAATLSVIVLAALTVREPLAGLGLLAAALFAAFVFVRRTVDGVGPVYLLAAYGCAITSSWTGIKALGLPLSDVFLGVMLCCWLYRFLTGKAPALRTWMFLGTVAGLVCLLAERLAPEPLGGYLVDGTAIDVFGRLFLTTTATAIAYASLIGSGGPRLPRRLAAAFLAGGAFSALVAVVGGLDQFGLGALIDESSGPRATGLTFHPNSLGCAIVVAIPVALWGLAYPASRFARWASASCLLTLLGGLMAADSRAGYLAGMLTLAVSGIWFIVRAAGRSRALQVCGYLLAIGTVGAVTIGSNNRLTSLGVLSDSQTDVLRQGFLVDGWKLFANAPVFGFGLAGGSGVSVPVLLASSGGVVLFVGYYGFVAATVGASWRRRRAEPLCIAGVLCALAGVSFGVLNNGAFERFLFIVPVICAAIPVVTRGKPGRSADRETNRSVADGLTAAVACHRDGTAVLPG